jgi:NTP pyrophosphatase (non-canonical NTP hydrolase)
MTTIEMNKLAKEIHAECHKWWHTPEGVRLDRNKGELLMLVTSELAEAMEGVRKNLPDDKLPHRKMVEVELADVVIRCLDYAGGFSLPIVQTASPIMTDNEAESLFRINDFVTRTYAAAQDKADVWESRLLSGVILGCYAYCDKFNLDLNGALQEKREFNKTRKDHTWEARAGENGKKF